MNAMLRRRFLAVFSYLASGTAVSAALGADTEAKFAEGRKRPAPTPRGLSGWRARIGILYPEDGVLDDEYFRMAPRGVTVHVTRLPSDTADPQESLIRACSLFKMINPDCITYGSNGGSFWDGVGTDQRLIEIMQKAASCPVSTASTGMIRALKKLGIQRLAVASPYWREANERLKRFLEGHGIMVVSLVGPEMQNGEQISSTPPQVMYRWAVEADRPEAQGVLLPCTNLRTLEILNSLEDDLQKPVVSGNQAMMWDALMLAEVHEPIEGYGRLLKTW